MRHLQSQSFNRKKRLKAWWAIVAIIGIIFVLAYASSWILRAHFLTLTDVTVFGADQDISVSIHDTALAKLTGNYFGLFPRSNSFIYPKSEIIESIQSTFPRILDVDVSRDSLNSLRITVNEKIPRAIVCVTLPNFDNNILAYSPTDPCYIADSLGLLFEGDTVASHNQYQLYYAPNISPMSSTTDFTGTYATSTAEFSALESFYQDAINTGIPVDGILLKDTGEYEMYASTTVIYFNDKEGLQNELVDLTAFWKHMMSAGDLNKKPPVFDYIDLRYGSNVFYKLIQ